MRALAPHGYGLLRVDTQDLHFVRLDMQERLQAVAPGLRLPQDESRGRRMAEERWVGNGLVVFRLFSRCRKKCMRRTF